MKNPIKPVWLAVALAVTATPAAQANDWYAGIGGGTAIAHGLDDFSQNADKNATALSLFGGYNVNQNLGAELGYLSAGDWDIRGTDFNSKGVTLSVIGRLPLNDIFSAFAEGGGYLYHVKSVNGGDDNLAPLAGLGLSARVHDWVDIQARYRYLVRVGDDPDNGKLNSGTQRWVSDISTATLELVIHPNRSKPADPEPTPAPAVVPPPPPPKPDVVDKTFNLSSDVLFAFGKTELKPEGAEALTALYQQIVEVQPKDGMATVVGYSDRIGSDANNLRLSEARAQTVADFLIDKGLPADKVTIQGNSESNPITGSQCNDIKARTALIDCLAPDRRVEVRVTGIRGTSE